MRRNLLRLYKKLLDKHGYQGWWPIGNEYHKKDYTYPHNEEEKFEIIIGCILTQNTSWKNVEKVISILEKKKSFSAKRILEITERELEQMIKSSGFYKRKARILKEFSKFYLGNKGKNFTREEFLKVWGIGKETADSILLYAYKKPCFVVDTYTKRILKKILNIECKSYDQLQEIFHENLSHDYKLFNEFHALIVAEGKALKIKDFL